MKPAAIAVLAVSLAAFPAYAGKTTRQKSTVSKAQKSLVSKAHCVKLEHIESGWRMQIACVEGRGTIVRLDSQLYQGDGIFARWTQTQMRSLFEALVPDSSDRSYLESPQLD